MYTVRWTVEFESGLVTYQRTGVVNFRLLDTLMIMEFDKSSPIFAISEDRPKNLIKLELVKES